MLATTAPVEQVLAVVAAAAGVLVGAGSVIAAARQAKRAAEAIRRASSSTPDGAIAALNLQALGDYVYETLGRIPVADYASNPSARRDVTGALEEIERFLDDASEGPQRPMQLDTEVAAARRALANGDVWQALARLRTAIEIDLRERARRNDLDVPERAGAGRLLRALVESKALPLDASGPLDYAIQVANRAVHGEVVPVAQADEAIYTASRALGVN